MKILLRIFLSILAIGFLSAAALAVPGISSFQSGNWNNATTWVGGVVPGVSDNVFILAGHTVTLDVSPTVPNCTVSGTAILDASTFTLTVSGTFTLASGATFKQGENGTIAIPGSIKSISSSSTYIYYGSQSSIPVSTVFGNLTWSSTAPFSVPAGNLTLNGTLTVNGKVLEGAVSGNGATHTVGNVVIDGVNAVLVGKNGSGAGTVTWNITGSVTTQNSGTLRALINTASSDVFFNVAGDFTNNGAFDVGTGSGVVTLTFNGSSVQTVSGVNPFDAQNVTINNSAGVAFTTDVGVNQGALTLASGALNNSTHLVIYSGSGITRGGGSLTAAPAFPPGIPITYTGSVTTGNELPTAAGDLGDLVINAIGGVTLGASATVNGTLILSSGKLTLGANNLTLASANPIVGASSSNYLVTNSTGYMIQNVPASNVTYPIGTASTYNPVILNNTGGTADNYSVRVASSTANTVTPSAVVGDQWTINEASAGGNNVVMTLQWNAGEEGGSFTPRSSGVLCKYAGSGTGWAQLATTVSGSGPYTASNNSAITNSFSNSIYGVGLPSALPVELTSFTATPRNAKVELAWATASEMNNYGFEVEKAIHSGLNGLMGWEKIGFVEGHFDFQ